jgi:integrase/recombinase XerD
MVNPGAVDSPFSWRGTEAMENSQPGPAVSGVVVTTTHVRRLAVAAYLARFKGQSRIHTESDLRGYLIWCEARRLDPLAATRPHIELYLRWLQEVRRYRPSTVSRRMSVVAGFYRTCVIDSVLEHSPAEYVRRPNVPAESPTLGLTHQQFEALLTAAKHSTNSCDFALVTMLGLLGLRIFEATGSDIDDLGEEHGHRVLRVRGNGDKVVLVPPPCGRPRDRARHRRSDHRPDPAHPARHPHGPSLRHATATATRRGRRGEAAAHASTHAAAHLRHHHARRRSRPSRCPDRRPPRRPTHHHALRPGPQNLDRHPNYILAAYMASGT